MVFLEPHLNCDGCFSSEVMITLEGKYSYVPLSFKHINSCDTIYVIGIANALDLMARFLPRLQSTKWSTPASTLHQRPDCLSPAGETWEQLIGESKGQTFCRLLSRSQVESLGIMR